MAQAADLTPQHRIFLAIAPDEVAVKFSAEALQRLRGVAEVVEASEPFTELPADLGDAYDAMVIDWSTPQGADQMMGGRLKLIASAAGSIRSVVPREVLEHGVTVTQGGSLPMAHSVAEAAIAMTLMGLRHLHTYDRGLQTTGDYAGTREAGFGRAMQETRVGVVGLSRTGVRYAELAAALGALGVVAYDPYWDSQRAAQHGVGLLIDDLDEVCSTSDVLAIHAPNIPETHHMIDARRLALLPDGAWLVNTARAALVDNDALLAEVRTGRLNAALDVFDEEPLPADSPWYGLPNVILAPHIAGATYWARDQQGDSTADEVVRHLTGQPLQYAIPLDIYDRLS